MAKLIILRGLPASGKSTWARSWCEDPANTWPHCVISLDDIRLMIAGSAQVRNRLQSEHGKRFNDMVVAMGRHMIADALDAGWDGFPSLPFSFGAKATFVPSSEGAALRK